MKKVVFLQCLAIPVLLFYSLGNLAVDASQRQRKVPLLSTICVEKPGSDFLKITDQVSIGREFFESVFRMGVPFRQQTSLVTCKIKSDRFPKFKRIDIKFGIADGQTSFYIGSVGPTKVNVYLDGEEAASKEIVEGNIDNISLDVKNVKSVAIEVSCAYQPQGCKPVSFIESSLLFNH